MPVPEGDRETTTLLERVAHGDREAFGALLDRQRPALLRMVRLRLDPRVRGRVGESDVVQEAALEAVQRLDEYLRDPRLPLLLWLRLITAQRLAMIHRRHRAVKARDVRRDVPLHGLGRPGVTSAALAEAVAASQTSPSEAAERKEMRTRLLGALDSMDPLDREVISLRHFEQLGNADVARELGLTESAASKRYVRAFRRLKGILDGGTRG